MNDLPSILAEILYSVTSVWGYYFLFIGPQWLWRSCDEANSGFFGHSEKKLKARKLKSSCLIINSKFEVAYEIEILFLNLEKRILDFRFDSLIGKLNKIYHTIPSKYR